MEKQTSKEQIALIAQFFYKRKKKVLVILVIILTLVDIFGYGNIEYAVKWVSCKERPVALIESGGSWMSKEGRALIVEKPSFFDAKSSLLSRGFTSYSLYCSLDQAKSIASPYTEVKRVK